MSSEIPKNYMPQLDGLRALAVGAVMYQHWIPEGYHLNVEWGSLGVQLFFVLSGFLITGILLKQKNTILTESLWAFYARRFLRIFPLYYAVLIVAYLGKIEPVPETFVWHFSYLSNFYFFFVYQDWNGVVTHFWSLAVEEQFYLIWPWLLLFWPTSKISKLIFGLITLGALSRLALEFAYPEMRSHQALLISNVDALGLGAILAWRRTAQVVASRKGPFFYFPLFLFLATQGISTVGYTLHPLLEWIRHESMLIGCMWIIAAAGIGFSGKVANWLTWAPLSYIGRISYGIYVIHNFAAYPIKLVCQMLGWTEPSELVQLPMKLIITIAGAMLSWHLFEAPINSLKRYFPYRAKSSQEPDSSPTEERERLAGDAG